MTAQVSRPSLPDPAHERRSGASVTLAYRYELRLRTEQKNDYQICWVMLNPSPRPPEEINPTRRAILWFSERAGFGKILVVNKYPAITKGAADLKHVLLPKGVGNDETVRAAMLHSRRVVFAWGSFNFKAMKVPPTDAQGIAYSLGIQPYCVGINADTAPKHPIFADRFQPLMPYRW